MKKLSGQDALFLHIDRPNAGTHGTMIYIYDQESVPTGKLRFKQIVSHIERRLEVAPFFRRKIVQLPLSLGYPYWALDDQFDINFHVRHSALPKPGDWRQFCILASRIQARQIDLSRPPWEMHVIEGLDNVDWLPKGSFAILTKGHHAAMDGSAFAELTWALHDLDAKKGRRVPVVRKTGIANQEIAPSTLTLLMHALQDNLAAPLRMAGPAAKVLPKLGAMAWSGVGRLLGGDMPDATKTRFNAKVSSQRVFDSAQFEFAKVKEIRAAVPGATVNDVVLAVVGGALRTYLQKHKELPKATLKAVSPVNTRADKSATTTSGNNISAVTFALRTDIKDPLERLRRVHEGTAQTKDNGQRRWGERAHRSEQIRTARYARLCRPLGDLDRPRRRWTLSASPHCSQQCSRAHRADLSAGCPHALLVVRGADRRWNGSLPCSDQLRRQAHRLADEHAGDAALIPRTTRSASVTASST